MRIKRGNVARNKRKKVLKRAKGFYGARGRLYGVAAKPAVTKAGVYAYSHRRTRRRDMRALWIIRISAAAKANGVSYSQLIFMLKKAKIALDRKILSDIAATDGKVFSKLVEAVKN
ncbi:50S ribosomal protein L20 [Candidatus Margulisiibacteriota bacterium]